MNKKYMENLFHLMRGVTFEGETKLEDPQVIGVIPQSNTKLSTNSGAFNNVELHYFTII